MLSKLTTIIVKSHYTHLSRPRQVRPWKFTKESAAKSAADSLRRMENMRIALRALSSYLEKNRGSARRDWLLLEAAISSRIEKKSIPP